MVPGQSTEAGLAPAQREDLLKLAARSIEAGLGGSAARSVADVLCEVSAGRQLLAITHLPAVAVRAGRHLQVTKHARDGRTTVTIDELDDPGRRLELARMVGVEGGKGTLGMVDELIREAHKRR